MKKIIMILSIFLLFGCNNNTKENIEISEETKVEKLNENEPTDQQIDELIDLIFEMEN